MGLATAWTTIPMKSPADRDSGWPLPGPWSTNHPLLLADEPTGNLDTKTGEEIMELFHQLNEQGHTIILVTHEEHIARYAQRILYIVDGEITRDEVVS